MKVTIGADPELFLVNSTGKFISSVGKFGGTKDKPKNMGKGCKIQEDNVTVEFNIPPSVSQDAFVQSIHYSLTAIKQRAEKLGLQMSCTPSAVFEDEELATDAAQTFGCEADYNAWTKTRNSRPYSENQNLRSAGGHVHIGCREFNPFHLGQVCDLALGVPSLQFDNDVRRRELYGKAGSIRPKSYGVEYRTLSNFWLASKELTEWVYKQTMWGVEFLRKNGPLPLKEGGRIMSCIDNGNINEMKAIMNQYGVTYGI